MSGHVERPRLVNNLPPPPSLFSDLRILKDFKSFVFGSADCKGVTGVFCGSADSTGFTAKRTLGGGASETARGASNVRIRI
jgi:hypothetical protein